MKVVHIDSGFMRAVELNTGWILVEGSGGIKGFVILRRIQNSINIAGIVLAEAAFSPQAAAKTIHFIPRVTSLSDQNLRDPVEIAYALANPDPALSASGEIQLLDGSTSSFILPPRGQMAEFASQRFSISPSTTTYVRIVMRTGTVSAIGLRAVGDVITPLQPQADSASAGVARLQQLAASVQRQAGPGSSWMTRQQ